MFCTWKNNYLFYALGAICYLVLLSQCFVDQQCFTDADCQKPDICDQNGECIFECSIHGDCLDYGVEYICKNYHCFYPQTCFDCSFPHATATCIQGNCQMDDCRDGYSDANNDPADGCECPLDENTDGCTDQDNVCDGYTDQQGNCFPCPLDMVSVDDQFCIDTYEASRLDATATQAGSNESIAVSQPGVIPWYVNPASYAQLLTFQQACQAAGKHLCTKAQWFHSCTSTENNTYFFGNQWDASICNSVDTFCQQYCDDNGIPAEECDTSINCGYSYPEDVFHIVPTGSFPACTNQYGAFDINGNVWELVPSTDDTRNFEVRGGAFNCANPHERLACDFNAGWNQLYAGFRCCLNL